MKQGIIVITAAVVMSFFALRADAATVSGTVKFSGTPPTMSPIAMNADPVCAHAHTKPVLAETLVLGPGQTMGNIFVRVKSGLPAGKKYPAPKDAVVLDQKGCHYVPHVFGLMVGQPLKIKNSDETLHNIHAMAKANPEFNSAMPKTLKEIEKKFNKPEVMVPIKCDVHPWMNGWAGVVENPFFAVTKEDGKFSITGLDPGTYEIEAWHEKLGTQTMKVTVAAQDTKTADFTFSKPTK